MANLLEEVTMPALETPVYEEPTIRRKLGRYEKVMAPLMEAPDTWAKIGEYSNDNSAYQACLNLRHGRYQIPGEPGDWEFVTDGPAVFARYVEQNKVETKK